LYAANEALPPLQPTILTLYHLDEMSIFEIARIEGLKAGTIKSHLLHCRALLRGRSHARMGVWDERRPRLRRS
jgi:RNA polymerase sigma-70 factor (ECF subfamily)